MGMTGIEKILARASGRGAVHPGEFVTAHIDFCRIRGLDRHTDLLIAAGVPAGLRRIWDPAKVLSAPGDNITCLNAVPLAERYRRNVHLAKKYRLPHFYDVSEGIAHQLMVENGHVHPGDLIVGDDSHTLMYGALNSAATAISDLEMTYVLTTGDLWFQVPETIRFVVEGHLEFPVMAKDVFLLFMERYGPDIALNRSIEWTGSTIDAMSLDGRLCLACSSTEFSAKFSIFPADGKVLTYLTTRSRGPFTPVHSDPDAVFSTEYTVDVGDVSPLIALPHGFDVIKPVSEVEGIPVDTARVGACSNGRLEDLAATAHILKNKRVSPDVVLFVAPASKAVLREALHAGIIDVLLDAGAVIAPPGCGPCTSHLLVTAPGDVDISATTRNFIGRHGSTEAALYLASPATVAASALRGVITDPRTVP